MKRMKKTLLMGVSLLLAVSLCGCLGNVVNLAENLLAGDSSPVADLQEESAKDASSSPTSPQEATPAPAKTPAPTATPTPAPETRVALNSQLTDLLGATNQQLIDINGLTANCLFYQGGAIADYADTPVPGAFILQGDYDAIMKAWEQNSDGTGNAANTNNFWPPEATIMGIIVGGPTISSLLGEPRVTDKMLNDSFGYEPELTFTAAGEGAMEWYDFDTWSGVYESENYQLVALFESAGTDKVLLNATLLPL